MIKNELELQVSFEAIIKAHKIRARCMEAIPKSEMQNDVIEGIDIQIRKIEDEIAEYLSKRNTKEKNLKMNNHKSKEDLLARITINPKVLVGKPTIRGLRISVEQILRALASNISVDEILADYPELEIEDIQAVLMYATELVAKQKVFPVGD